MQIICWLIILLIIVNKIIKTYLRMFNLEYLWAWTDAMVYRKWNTDRVLKFYTINDIKDKDWEIVPECLSENKIRLYHDLQNSFSNRIFHLDFDYTNPRLFTVIQIIKSISFEILNLDSGLIWTASSNNWQKKDWKLIVAEIDFVKWKTLEDVWAERFWQDSIIFIAELVSKRIEDIYVWTQIANIIWKSRKIEICINPNNFKCSIKDNHMHLVVTDTLNCIWLLKV